jgi:Ser-tRNA(Ala) deacylase AlaX
METVNKVMSFTICILHVILLVLRALSEGDGVDRYVAQNYKENYMQYHSISLGELDKFSVYEYITLKLS